MLTIYICVAKVNINCFPMYFLALPYVQPAWLANAADDPSYKPRIQRISAVPMKEESEYHDPDENASSTSPVSPNAHPPPTPPSHKNSAPPIPPRHRVGLTRIHYMYLGILYTLYYDNYNWDSDLYVM